MIAGIDGIQAGGVSCGDTAGANGYMITDRASEELAAAIKTVAAGGLYLSPGIAGLAGRRPS
jgi:DNA-binding NarL/FixJ family response regulator